LYASSQPRRGIKRQTGSRQTADSRGMQTECAGSRQKYASPQRPEEAAADIKRQADSRQQAANNTDRQTVCIYKRRNPPDVLVAGARDEDEEDMEVPRCK
jgi:hypothetical protein